MPIFLSSYPGKNTFSCKIVSFYLTDVLPQSTLIQNKSMDGECLGKAHPQRDSGWWELSVTLPQVVAPELKGRKHPQVEPFRMAALKHRG